MTIKELLYALPADTNVRIYISLDKTVTGVTGARRTRTIVERLAGMGYADAHVLGIYPLWHAQELYVEVVKW